MTPQTFAFYFFYVKFNNKKQNFFSTQQSTIFYSENSGQPSARQRGNRHRNPLRSEDGLGPAGSGRAGGQLLEEPVLPRQHRPPPGHRAGQVGGSGDQHEGAARHARGSVRARPHAVRKILRLKIK